MRSIRLSAFVLVFALAIVATARAAEYSSPILQAPAGNNLFCIVSNVGAKAINVTVVLHDFNGNVVTASDTCLVINGVLPAGRSCSSGVAGPSTGTRCTVNASGKVRVEMVVVDSGGNITASMAATK